ncbi:MAG: DUF4159 domain-containing protein [Candidatus Cloacimonadota bacterium]|nr:DUF4159 domain-containing protein [Candidatus Cloacimonadota bacterium]
MSRLFIYSRINFLKKSISSFVILFLFFVSYTSAEIKFTIARVQYDGGGDWYNDTSVIPNLLREINNRTNINAAKDQVIVSLKDNRIFNYPFLYLTGHGNIVLSDEEIKNLREYLKKGGFLYVDDDYGLDKYFRREIARVFPNKSLQELPSSHPIFSCFYHFENGLPKIHEHDNKRPQAFALFNNFGRMIVLYTYESNISDGWASPDVHKDPPEIRERAFKMGINIVYYVLTH